MINVFKEKLYKGLKQEIKVKKFLISKQSKFQKIEIFDTQAYGRVLALDGIKDPGNLGTIIRLADWFGVKDIICSDDCVDYLNPKVVQSSMGSFTRVNLHYTSLTDAFKKYSDYKLTMTVLNGTPLSEMKNTDKKIIVMGSESKGISKEILELTSEKITIPKSKSSKAESLNVSIAAAIILNTI